MKKNLEEYLTTPPSDPLPPKPYVPKAKPAATREDNPVKERENRPDVNEEKQNQFNQLPPSLPGVPPSGEKSKEQRGEKK